MKILKNWGENVILAPAHIHTPASCDEAIALVQQAARSGTKLRVVGSLHSWSEIIACGPADVVVDTTKLNKILVIDATTKRVWVEGGTKLHALIDALANVGLALPNQGYITDQSVAGAIATATHGSGPTGSFSSMVTAIKLIDGTGQLRELSATSSPELFYAAQTHVGACGFIYAVELQVRDAFALLARRELTTLGEALRQRGDYNWFMWNPYTKTAVTLHHSPTPDRPSRTHFRTYYERVSAYVLLKLSRLLPFGPAQLAELYLKNLACPAYVDNSYRVFSPHQAEPQYLETEMAIDAKDMQAAVQDMNALAKGTNQFAAIFLVRFGSANNDALLDMAAGRDTAYLSMTIGIQPSPRLHPSLKLWTTGRRTGLGGIPEGALALLEEFACMMIQKYAARPHWGKIYKLSREEFLQLYGENARAFIAARNQLDPQGIFLNKYTRQLFAP